MRLLLPRLMFLVSVWLVFQPSEAQEWTRFRGPNGAGLSDAKSLAATWTEADYDWRIELPGQGHSSPVLWGDRIFLISADPETATRYVLCYSATDGRELWRRDFPSEPHHLHQRNTYASSTPAVDGQRVYVTWADPARVTLMALDHDGNDKWNLDLGPWTSQHGYGTSPMLHDGMVILNNCQQADQLEPGQKPGKSFMIAVDAETGKEVWRTPRVAIRVCYSTPSIYRPANGAPELICTSTGEGVYSLDPKNGKENWRVADVLSMRVVSSPLVAGNVIFGSTGSGGGGNYVAAIRAGKKPELAYKIKTSAPYVPLVVARDGLAFLFYDRGIVSCIDVHTGDVFWRERVSRGFSGSPVIADGKVYCIGDEGVVYVLAASNEFRLLGENALGEPTRSTPAIAGNRLYLRTLSHLTSVGGKAARRAN